MSSYKNVIPKRSYQERGQAKERLHLGELEKKVDYGKRREIYKKKKKIENVLKEKIMNRNPDEFHTGMVHSRITDATNELEKEEKVQKTDVVLKNKRNHLKEETNALYRKLKKINKALENYYINIPLRYLFNNSHELYNDKEETTMSTTYVLKAEKKKLKSRALVYQRRYNSLLNLKKNVLSRIRKMDNMYANTYKNVDGYCVLKGVGGAPHRFFAPRLR
ncbi:u3 small nucleolar rna-associated protein, putative [Plasmodium knowlesi strain H]|uniref:U3 small nucleolar RNA-associated protein 11 n=2 Tax=Plasmodium knowlesi (strain H) TaxID=5851 RepID=A0A5K1U0M2_PLAKH|nr:U3 small nucleolar RNA-associated protein 11, putative [Plasmodium knowlesi strain H]CAA9991273.1 U3 small nucleolar RNA-associated protein 11, putative [Plasmodium knowlesi strain H]SBO26362.1 u3 small nucleolar rna-associated protein, putative [Plasmodium knowlesi strain H]SBO29020.1 u3 small nucleolar rna-associated protein, putative [Plasmodium knowlesi strain H]VVS80747.1 U3 small nucleolar RNA-associated protein 11, putative [Plasmodium knowlesi strain H]|eukprot:XP_002262551.1 u3 small nucleolar rna-associated protein,putative [Plasmodium knowlesi strain H]